MKLTNPNSDRSILACIEVGQTANTSGDLEWFEIPAGESIELDDYVVASTLVEHGATASPDELAAARELWAERNRTINSRTASASASEGEIVQRRQATVSVATGTADDVDKPLAGQALAAAVAEANAAGAEIKSTLSAGEKRDALAEWQRQRGSSTPVDGAEFETDVEGELVFGPDGDPIPAGTDGYVRDEAGNIVTSEGVAVVDASASEVGSVGEGSPHADQSIADGNAVEDALEGSDEPSDQQIADASRGDV